MDGVLVIDKPAGPTSHDVVARVRRALGEPRIGHTGTLDPAATGVLALVLGRATRLAQFFKDSDKSYEAVVRFGFATDTADAQGRAIGAVSSGPLPSPHEIGVALEAFRGTFLQQPPAFSAKKIGGKRSHKLARARARDAAADAPLTPSSGAEQPDSPDPAPPSVSVASILPAPASVTAHAIAVVGTDGETVTLRIDCSAGFYVRSLAHDLGERLGVGAHLVALRRTRVGDFTLDRALPLESAESDPVRAAAAIVPMADVLPRLPSFVLTAGGVRRARNGCELGPADSVQMLRSPGSEPHTRQTLFRLLDAAGNLVGVARPARTAGLLHPCVILG
jgi:tRNA pseudouridine55 synthase